jgi:hypothetical protein
MALVKVEGTTFLRDTNTMALINENDEERISYYEKINMMKNQRDEINNVKNEINEIKSDLSQIKELMLKLLDKE